MDTNVILQMASGVIAQFRQSMDQGHVMMECEALAYEQACRTYETIMRSFREQWEKHENELEVPKD